MLLRTFCFIQLISSAFSELSPTTASTGAAKAMPCAGFSSPVVIKVDGMKKEGVVMLPGVEQ